LRLALIVCAGLALVVGLAGLGWIFAITRDLPSARELANYEPPITSRVHAGDGRLVAEFASQHRIYVPSEELPEQLIQAFISAEDKTFFEHSGLDYVGILRAAVSNVGSFVSGDDSVVGGSTISQQVAKNMLLSSEKKMSRKVREAFLTLELEKLFTKEEILELYMNEIFLGGRSYGVAAASLNYFGKSLGDLTLAESALLAALPQQPSRVNPYNHPEAAVARRNWVLDRMVANGFIDAAAAETAKAEPLTTVKRLNSDEIAASAYFVEEVRREILRLGEAGKLDGFGSEKEAEKGFYEGGLSIRSTLDTRLQLAAETALQAGLETADRRKGWRGPVSKLSPSEGWAEALAELKAPGGAGDWTLALVRSEGASGVKLGFADGSEGALAADDVRWAASFKRKEGGSGLSAGDVVLVSRQPAPEVTSQTVRDYAKPSRASGSTWRLRQIPEVEGALVALDPHTGRVLAMAGGYSFGKSQFNRVVQAKRQPGSAFKPFVYLAALENGWTPSDRILDAPFVDCSDRTQQGCYKPSNYSDEFYGMSTLRVGVEKSRNAMTVRLAQDMGHERVSEIGERVGAYDDLPPYPSMSLGAGETTPLRMAIAYAALVNGGKRVEPILMDRIQNRYGETVFRSDQRACEGCLAEWDGQGPPALPDLREQTVDPVAAYQMVSMLEGVVERGTGASIKAVGKPVAGKTGTTNDQMDAWFIGFSPDLVAAVWVGHDTPRNMGVGESGGRVATPIFRDFMIEAMANAPALPFRIPAGVRSVEIDADTGCLPRPESRLVILEAYRPGTEPQDQCLEAVATLADYSVTFAGDEGGYAPVDGENTPPAPPVDGMEAPARPDAAAAQVTEDLTLRDGIF
jgi:penicillin-binding protein 1A